MKLFAYDDNGRSPLEDQDPVRDGDGHGDDGDDGDTDDSSYEPQDEPQEEGDEESFDSEYDDDDSSYDSAIDHEAARLMSVLQPPQAVPQQPPSGQLNDYLTTLQTGNNTALKIPDSLVSWIRESDDDDDDDHTDQEGKEKASTTIASICDQVISGLHACHHIQHVILGRVWLRLMNPQQHETLYQALFSQHAATVTFVKFGSDDSTEASPDIPTPILLEKLSSTSLPALTELELRGLCLDDTQQVEQCVQLVQQTPTLKLFNLLGMDLALPLRNTPGLFDAVLRAAAPVAQLDEVQLSCCLDASMDSSLLPALVSTATLETLFATKPKWWRLNLDGMQLRNDHVHVIARALRTNDTCRVNDLLSLQDNPQISPAGLHTLYTTCLNKQRMGLVLSDDATWVATMDLVRPLNNLHRRLEYKEMTDQDGLVYVSKARWIDWLVALDNLPWLDDRRKLNYVWFTLLDQPTALQLP